MVCTDRTGIGNKENSKFIDIYGVDNAGQGGRTKLEDALRDSVTLPTISAGSSIPICTSITPAVTNGSTRPGRWVWPSQGTVVVQKGSSTSPATPTNDRGQLPAHNFQDVPFQLIDARSKSCPVFRGLPTPGHVPYHQSILIESGGEKACFVADLVPTSTHLPLPWIMGYDSSRS